MKKILSFFVACCFFMSIYAQSVPTDYSVGTWSGFRNSAATFTFDDGCANQSTATATLDAYGYKASFYPPTSWVSNWSVFQTRVNNGHEVGSHSVNHGNTMPDSEIQQSKSIINANITGQDCNTITYPNCNEPSESVLKQYYIGGRICNGQVEGPTPSNYYQIGSLICGDQGSYNSLSSFQTAFTTAINKNGWAVFLIHEIDNGNGQANGYSPLSSSLFEQVVSYVHDNDSKIWLTTFRNAILYSQERDKLSLTETAKSATQYTLSASVSITSSVVTYDFPVTVRRVMPSGWTNFAASLDGKDIAVKTITSGGKTYAQFDVVPGKTYTLEDRKSEYTEEGEDVPVSKTVELIENGEFDDGTSYWQTQVGGDAKCNFSTTTSAGMSGSNAAELCPNGTYGTENWHIQAFQNVALEGNVTYTLSFSAKASTARILYVMVQKIAADYDTYFYKEYNLTTTSQTFEETIVAPSDVASDSKLTFCIGGADGCVTIDKVSFSYENTSSQGDDPGENPSYDVDITGDISKYFIDKAYVGPSCDALEGEEVTTGAYFTGEYPNLFVTYLGKTQAEVDQKVKSVFNQLFNPKENVGDKENNGKTVYYEVGSDMAYIYAPDSKDVRTEGMSYGMMICVQMGDQDKFDKIWRWAKKYMQYKKGDQREGLFAWQCNTDGSIKGSSCAPDGEMYFLTALWFASHRWGNDGSVNYEEEAQYLAKCILNKSGRSAGQVCPIFNYSNHIVTFGETSYDFTDPSYNLPGFLELWARWSNTNKDFWAQTPAAARTLLQKSCHSTSGLYPDYSSYEGQPYKPSWAGYNTERYQYDACRSAMNVGMDYNWFAVDSKQLAMTERTLSFFKKDNFAHGYFNWDGSNADGGYNQAMHGSNGAAVLALRNNESLGKTYVQRLWETQTPSGLYRYYNGLVYFLGMLHTAGYFKIYKPCPEVIEENLNGPSPVVFNEVEYTKDTTFKTLIDCKIYDVTITIEESATTYTVVFKDYNGDELKSEEVEEGESATAPTKPTRTGYTFKEWDTDFTNVTENLVVTAVYEINTYKVTFVDYDGSTLKEQTVEYGNAATAPADPTRTGYTFDGWDTDFSNVTEELTVKATYSKIVETGKYEAENAQTTEGAELITNTLASNGKYVKMKGSESLTFAVTVEDAGMYTLDIVFTLAEDYKAQDLYVNGDKVALIGFNRTTSSSTPVFTTLSTAVNLQKGSNTIALQKSWGWVDIDYIELSSYERTKLGYAENLVTPNPQPSAVQVYDFIKENYGKNIISSVMTLDMMDGMSPLTLAQQHDVSYIYSTSGKYPAAVGFDFMQATNYDKSNTWFPLYNDALIDMAKELWESNGIPMFMWHWKDPTKATSSFGTDVSFSLKDAFTDESCTTWNTSSSLYKSMMEDIAVVANHLLDLQCEGVSVVWRPLHEASGAWFWWGASGANAYKQLYKLLFDKLVNEYGLHNLIWVWTSCGNDADWYPGDEYVDIVGRDMYVTNHGSLATEFEALAKLVDGKKIVTLAECGAMPYPENLEQDAAMWSWFMPWYDEGDTKYLSSGEYNTPASITTTMTDSRTITLDDMTTKWDNRTKLYDTTAAKTLYAKSGFSVTPNAEGDFEYEITLPSEHGCDSVVVLYLHATPATTQYFKVTFVDGLDNSTIEEQTVAEGDDATAPSVPKHEHYTFTEWDADYTNVSTDITVTAVFTEDEKADYSKLDEAISAAESLKTTGCTEESIDALQSALAAAKLIEKDLYADSQSIIDAAATILNDAISGLTKQTFSVVFNDWDGTSLSNQSIEYGQNAVAPSNPSRTGYKFTGWDKEFTNITANLTVTAQYKIISTGEYPIYTGFDEMTVGDPCTRTEWEKEGFKYAWGSDASFPIRSEIVDTQSVSSSYSLQITYPEGGVGPENGGAQALFSIPQREEIYSSYYVKFSENFSWGGTNKEGKLPGICGMGNWNVCDGGKMCDGTNGFSARPIWYGDGQLMLYLYDMDKTGVYGVNYPLKDADGNQIVIQKGEWIHIAERVKVNTVTNGQANYDGEVEFWINGVQALSITGYRFITTDDQINVFYFDTFQGGSGSAYAPSTTCYTWFDDITISDNYDDVKYVAPTVETFTVTFIDWDETVLKEQTVKEGESAVAPTTMSREGYTFDKWDADFSNITANLTVKALYKENEKADYTALNKAIKDAEEVETEKYTEATVAELTIALNDAKNIDKTLEAKDQDIIDNATIALTSAMTGLITKTFTVTFKADDKIISSQTVNYGESATVPSTPSEEGYDFVKWNGSYTNVTNNVTVVAEFVIKVCSVTFKDWDGTVLNEQSVEYNQSAVAPTQPSREGYEFSGWDIEFTNVVSNIVVTAQYTKKGMANYTALNAAIAKAEAVETAAYTESSIAVLTTALANAKAVDPELFVESQSIVDNAATALNNALSALVAKEFTVTFIADGATLSTQIVTYGKTATAPKNPSKIGYTFIEWNGDYSNVTSNLTIEAVFEVKTFIVTFVDYENTVLSKQTIEYGKDADVPESPTRVGYDFTGWVGTYTNVKADATIKANYTQKSMASYSVLDNVIAVAKELKEFEYTPTSWSALQQTLATAKAVDRNLYSEQQFIVDAASSALQNAINALVKIDRTQLASTISVANSLYSSATEGYNRGQYIVGSKATLQTAINNAKAVYEKISVTQQELDVTQETLQIAIEQFKASIITADKSNLLLTIAKANQAIAKANGNTGSGSGQYPTMAVMSFQSAIDEAQQTYETETLQAIIDNQVIILNDAIDAFLASVNPITVDTSKLADLIAQATDLLAAAKVGSEPGQYPLLEYMDLFTARQGGNQLINNANSKQKDIDTQVKVIQDAINAFISSQIPLAIDDVNELSVEVYTAAHTIIVRNATDNDITIYDNTGRNIQHTAKNEVFDVMQYSVRMAGVYFVRVGEKSHTVIVR